MARRSARSFQFHLHPPWRLTRDNPPLPYREQSSELGVLRAAKSWEENMNGLIYLVGLIVVVLFILSFFGLR
jgi:hypothetical protein